MFTDEQAEEAWGNLADHRQAVPLVEYWTAKVLGHETSFAAMARAIKKASRVVFVLPQSET